MIPPTLDKSTLRKSDVQGRFIIIGKTTEDDEVRWEVSIGWDAILRFRVTVAGANYNNTPMEEEHRTTWAQLLDMVHSNEKAKHEKAESRAREVMRTK